MARTGKAAGVVASIDFYYCCVVFVFSIGFWDLEVAKTGKAVRVAGINRVMLLLLFSFCILYWCLGHESGQNRQGYESG